MKPNVILLGLAAIFSTWFSSEARAFQLEDHALITQIAVAELNACNPEHPLSAEQLELIITSNRNEDLNLGNKWLVGYSHFFNPNKILDMLRYPASTRVMLLSNWIEDNWDQEDLKTHLSDFGHLVHQLQDMSVPLHVLPVMHTLTDKFESYRNKDGLQQNPVNCSFFKIDGDIASYMKLMIMSARETLLQTSMQVPDVLKNGEPVHLPWGQLFWKEGDGAEFGDYGLLGNHFGETKISLNKDTYEIKPEVYETFRKAQMRQAIDITKLALYKIWIQHKLYAK